MEVKIQILTPLWTGGVDAGKCDRIHETGILGSLRWWMEVLVRGMGGQVCEPTEQKCSAKNGLCNVCKIFGAEGQKRRFRLDVVQDNTKPDKDVLSKVELQPYQYKYKDKQGQEKTGTRTPTWHFPEKDDDKPKVGTFILKIQGLHPDFKPEIIGGLIQFIADWSALGARPQMGFGVIQIMDKDFSKPIRLDTRCLYDWLKEVEGKCQYLELPSLQNIFLAKIQPKKSKSSFQEQDTFNLKYDLRNQFRVPPGKPDSLRQLRHFIMGTVDGNRQAAKIKISRPYPHKNSKWMRVWGWVPAQAEVYKNGWDREKVVDVIYQHLAANYTLHDWREMNSVRDTKAKNISDANVFLRSLLELQESSDAV